MSDITETALNWDHDTGRISVSTRRRAVVSKLKRLGLKPDTEEIFGYTTFTAHEDDLKVSFRKPRTLSDEQRAAAAKRMKAARKAS